MISYYADEVARLIHIIFCFYPRPRGAGGGGLNRRGEAVYYRDDLRVVVSHRKVPYLIQDAGGGGPLNKVALRGLNGLVYNGLVLLIRRRGQQWRG